MSLNSSWQRYFSTNPDKRERFLSLTSSHTLVTCFCSLDVAPQHQKHSAFYYFFLFLSDLCCTLVAITLHCPFCKYIFMCFPLGKPVLRQGAEKRVSFQGRSFFKNLSWKMSYSIYVDVLKGYNQIQLDKLPFNWQFSIIS